VVTAADNRISDEALVSAMAGGDQDSLATLNQRYGRALGAVADRILHDKADAEEVAADVLWQLWREASRFDRSRGSVGAWIMMTVRSRAIDRLRARKAREPRGDNAAEVNVTDDPSNEIHSSDRRRKVGNRTRDFERRRTRLAAAGVFLRSFTIRDRRPHQHSARHREKPGCALG